MLDIYRVGVSEKSCSSASLANSIEEKSKRRIRLLFSTASNTESFIPVHLPVKVELLKGKAGFRLGEPGHLRSYRHSGELFWLFQCGILVGTIVIPFAPCHIMGGQLLLQECSAVFDPQDRGASG